jgi:hypothetical protein
MVGTWAKPIALARSRPLPAMMTPSGPIRIGLVKPNWRMEAAIC